ncbi:ATP-binding protein [Anaerobacillus isosaccharinicus]|uniref:ATP-binding protein n=1 Tax=Anaerobacillus isosaccharinicus TaxID=1532552 RepID=A0A1S2M3L1_9BACI|nr:ATP-binding protein [Anaerobacillus isosaccharinicus]MBA5586450.1 ATP-binding protein [Anaerobacillus isosaccharinicus]QOY35307.1 ATP-binding protein [Anaerobacillus isosaccharinicus]
MNIKKRDSSAILNSLSGGVVPSRGLQYIMVGRADEAKQILADLQNIKGGSSVIKLFIGPFGSGKSFIQALIQQIAFQEKFVVAKADFTPERRLYGSDGKAVSIYTELMKNMAIATVPDGGALPTVLDKWISDVQSKVVIDKNYGSVAFDNPDFIRDVEHEITYTVSKMDDLIGGYDFSRILIQYFKGFVEDNSELQRKAIKWLRGEYKTKTEARTDLGVRDIIDDNNYYNYLKVVSQFVKQIGYSGLVVNLDEAINLYKITHPQTRDKNYETILKIYNDTLQGNVEGLYFTLGGTPEFLEDERRGLFSYGALKRRLESNRFETNEFRDLSQPVIKLTPLKHDETYVLLQKLREIHATHHVYQSTVTDDEIKRFIIQEYSRPGADENLTVGDVIRAFLGALNILHQNPYFNRIDIFGEEEVPAPEPRNTVHSRFATTEGE